jgi:hypothetical protein
MLPTPDFISTFIQQQFPAFYREEGPQFIEFVKAYYEWMEETGEQTHKTRNLFATRDIDLTADAFVENFKRKYLQGIPKEIAGDKRFLQKHILDLYRSKGSLEGLKLLFRLLYDEEIQIYIPSYDMLKPSSGKWVEKKYLEVSFTSYNYNFNNKIVTGVTSGATAFVESFERSFVDNRIINIFYISHIQGEFQVDERVVYEGLGAVTAPRILGSPTSITINATTKNNVIGDILLPSDGSGSGSGLKTIVSNTRDAGSKNATIEFKIVRGGYGYSTNSTITIGQGSNSTGTGATFTGITLKDVTNFTYSPTLINYAPYYPVTKTFNANSITVNSTSDFISIANNVFANNDRVLYTTSTGNSVLTGLTNNTSYWVVSANSIGLKLSTTRGGANINITALSGAASNGHNLYKDAVIRFDANSSVNSTTDFISIPNNLFANGDHVKYLVEAGNTAISGLTNSTVYYVSSANSTGLKLSTAYATAQVNITAGLTQYGHTLAAINVASYTLGSYSYGSSMNNTNRASIISSAIVYITTQIGTIDKLTGINPGAGYDGWIDIKVVDPVISRYGLPTPDGIGIKGDSATIYGNVVIGTGLVDTVRVLNSGLGYHTKLEDITIYNDTQANTDQKSDVTINLGGVGTQEGFWADKNGFLSSNKKIQDSYYYQEYSYEIKSSKALARYKKILKEVFHPVGNELFGRALLQATDDTQQAIISNPQTIYRILGSELAASVTFNGNSGVNSTTEYITTIGTNTLSDGDYVLYYQDTGNVESFNASSITNNYIITSNTNSLQTGDYVQYRFGVGNTAVSGLTYNSKYYVISGNSTALQLSTTLNGSAINITSGASESGHYLYQIIPAVGGIANNGKYFVTSANSSSLQLSTTEGGPPINITSTSREDGQHLVQSVPASGNAIFLFNISRLT